MAILREIAFVIFLLIKVQNLINVYNVYGNVVLLLTQNFIVINRFRNESRLYENPKLQSST